MALECYICGGCNIPFNPKAEGVVKAPCSGSCHETIADGSKYHFFLLYFSMNKRYFSVKSKLIFSSGSNSEIIIINFTVSKIGFS